VSRRLLVVVSFLLVFGATAAVRTGERAPQPTTVAKVRGSIEALAQDGRRIAWMETNASCGKQVQILTLPRRRPVYVGSSQGESCRLRGRTFGAIALTADGRVLWQGLAGSGNTEFDYDVFTAALRARGHASSRPSRSPTTLAILTTTSGGVVPCRWPRMGRPRSSLGIKTSGATKG
jgi:hypothetical protein